MPSDPAASGVETDRIAGLNSANPAIDVACTHCRERKVRCDRERPQCSNCKRDDAECDYQVPGKRVNHIKLLCHNVDGLDGRLTSMERQMSRLVSTLENVSLSIQKSDPPPALSTSSTRSNPSSDELSTASFAENSEEAYHGPVPLKQLCLSLRESLSVSDYTASTPPEVGAHGRLGSLLNHMCSLVADEQCPAPGIGSSSPGLPHKQYVMRAQAQFFQQLDCTTDIFTQSHFLASVERLYSCPIQPSDEPWIICLQTVVLLILGPELFGACGVSTLEDATNPLLLPSSAALTNPRLLMTPRLINVQALILLSMLSQTHESQTMSEMLFAHACTLAKTMGLHRPFAAADNLDANEKHERVLVFRSLYVRDKSLAFSRGSISWLSDSYEPAVLNLSLGYGAPYQVNVDIACLQGEIYRLTHRSKPWRKSSTSLHHKLTRLQSDLRSLAQKYDIFNSNGSSSNSGGKEIQSAQLQLELLSTRIAALQESSSPLHHTIVLGDARLCCLVLLLAFNCSDQDTLEQYRRIISINWPSEHKTGSRNRHRQRSAEHLPMRFGHGTTFTSIYASLFDAFPASALFQLVRNILWPSELDDGYTAAEDIALLQAVEACFLNNAPLMPTGSYARNVGSTLHTLLKIIACLRGRSHSAPDRQISQPFLSPAQSTKSSARSEGPGPLKPHQDQMDISMPQSTAWIHPSSYNQAWAHWPQFPSGGASTSVLPVSESPGMRNAFSDFSVPFDTLDMTWQPAAEPDDHLARKRSRTDGPTGLFSQAEVAEGSMHDDFLTPPDHMFFQRPS